MRFDSSELSGTMSEIVAYGTAVVVAPDASTAPDDAGRMSWGFGAARLHRPGRRPDAWPWPAWPSIARRRRGAARSPALWLIGIGIAFIVGTLIERVRYRSEAADRSRRAASGPAAANRRAPRSSRGSGAATRSSSTRRRAGGCASGSIRHRRAAVRRRGLTEWARAILAGRVASPSATPT